MTLQRSSSFNALLLLWLAGNGLRLTLLAVPPVLALKGGAWLPRCCFFDTPALPFPLPDMMMLVFVITLFFCRVLNL